MCPGNIYWYIVIKYSQIFYESNMSNLKGYAYVILICKNNQREYKIALMSISLTVISKLLNVLIMPSRHHLLNFCNTGTIYIIAM